MKDNKRAFIIIEVVLGLLVVVIASVMFYENNNREITRISVILPDSDDNRWAALKYGFRMAAQDMNLELSIVNTSETLSQEKMQELIDRELDNGSEGIIVQPVDGEDTEDMLKKYAKKVPVMLVECAASAQKEDSALPVVEPDNYAMGVALAEQFLKSYSVKSKTITIGFVSDSADSEAITNRKKGFLDTIKDADVTERWSASGPFNSDKIKTLEFKPKVDCIIALDDNSVSVVSDNTHRKSFRGALVFGIGTSTEAIYYLDTKAVASLVVPDEFNVGYESVQEMVDSLNHFFYKMQSQTVTHKVLDNENLFLEENQQILYTMNQ